MPPTNQAPPWGLGCAVTPTKDAPPPAAPGPPHVSGQVGGLGAGPEIADFSSLCSTPNKGDGPPLESFHLSSTPGRLMTHLGAQRGGRLPLARRDGLAPGGPDDGALRPSSDASLDHAAIVFGTTGGLTQSVSAVDGTLKDCTRAPHGWGGGSSSPSEAGPAPAPAAAAPRPITRSSGRRSSIRTAADYPGSSRAAPAAVPPTTTLLGPDAFDQGSRIGPPPDGAAVAAACPRGTKRTRVEHDRLPVESSPGSKGGERGGLCGLWPTPGSAPTPSARPARRVTAPRRGG